MSDDLFEKLDQEQAAAWKPEEGDKIVGTVTHIGEWTGEYGTSTTVTIEAEDGSTEEGGEAVEAGALRTFYASSTAAASQLERANPSVGDRIGVAYKGKQTGKAGREYHDYRVAVDRKVPLAAGSAQPAPATESADTVGEADAPGSGDDDW